MFNLQSKLKHIKSKIKHWNIMEFGNIYKEKSILEGKLKNIHKSWTSGNITEDSKELEKELMTQWQHRSLQEETLWKQKSRVQWLKEGEQNTKFFHRSTLDYRNANKILNLKNEAGDTLHNHREIFSLLTEHFKHIAQETHADRAEAINTLTQSIPKVVTNDQNLTLLKEISMEEVEEAVKSMPNDKAPGLDGFTINFYKACWPTIKSEIWEVVEDSRRSGTILKSLNSTFLALIPKEENAHTPEKFRPIALCNVIYKIISKVIENRLKPILPNLISEEQSGYVEGRQIQDNILLAQEMVHTLQTRKKVGMVMQLDLSKAFDKVNWNYLEAILTAFGFDQQWINWILALIKSSSFSILVNGSPSETFIPSRGIRQGDPLSPFLFVILMEGVSRLIHKAKEEGNLRGLHPLQSIPATTHQQFMDDTLLHGTPTVKEALAFKSILILFNKASGMEINHAKSKIFFFNTHLAIQKHLSSILGFKRGNLPSKYLGAPLTSKPWQKHHWESTLAKLENKCRHWTHRALNFAGRLVLTKAILQAIPHYMLSILPTPQVGGLNLIDPLTSNITCGAKLWWRWLKEPHLPWARHWKEKYTPNCNEQDLIRLQEVPEGSPIWNLARRNRNIIQDHSFWEIRNGETNFFWGDAWQQLPRLAMSDLENYKREAQTGGNYRVSQYWSPDSIEREWRTWKPPNSISFTADNAQIQSLLSTLNKIKIRSSSVRDQLRWGMRGNGSYTLKEARMQLEQNEQGETLPWSTKVWDSLFWPKIKTFLWLLMRGKTLTWDNLQKKGFSGPSICPMCRKLTLSTNIHELISAKCTTLPDSNLSPRDQCILVSFKLENGNNSPTISSKHEPRTEQQGWHMPPTGFLKLNFDGASRGNPGPAGIGGVIRNHKGEILYIYSPALGEAAKNEMEFAAMEKGLRILHTNQIANAIIEGDSEVAITVARRIYNGTPASRVMKH
eukprot:PITA_36043